MIKKYIDFTGKRKLFLAISAILIIVSIISILAKGFSFGVDFAGGTEIAFLSNKDLSVAELRDELKTVDPSFETAKIVKLTNTVGQNENEFRYSVTTTEFYAAAQKEALIENLPDLKIESFSTVSGFAASELQGKSWWIAIFAIIIILAYIILRFKYVGFGLGAIAALVHDCIITLGLFSLFGIAFDVSVVAAILTLIGYSLNDTIVVYDRIRENMKKNHSLAIDKVINNSINEVLTRTINTSLTTFIVVGTMLFFGGAGLKPFAFALTVGVIVGTYSSIYIASPILIGFIKRRR